jgi:serine/threonine-protein kinase
MVASRDLAAGSVLGPYELVLRVASGGMGEIWAARLHGSRGFHKLFAVKTLRAELSHDVSFEQMFLDEAQVAAKIKHPNVVEVIDLGEENQILYQVMEWVEGASLWAVMRAAAKRKERALPLPVAASILCQICSGLHAAHELTDPEGRLYGVVHRDVSPQNVLLTPHGIAKVVDFGVAKFAGRGVAATTAGDLRGKVPYMAPEHVLGEDLDRRADVFALGVLFYQLVSGVHPFLGDHDTITLARISSATPATPLVKRVPALSAELSDVVDQALAKKPADRIATAAQLRKLIEQAVPGAGSDSNRQQVADYCRGLGSEHFPAHARELRAALRALDDPLAPPDRVSGAFSTASIPSGARQSLSSIPTTPPGVSGPSEPSSSPAPRSQPAPEPIAPAPPRRRWGAVAGAAVVIGGLAAGAFVLRATPKSAAGSLPAPASSAASALTRAASSAEPAAAPSAVPPIPAESASALPSASASAPLASASAAAPLQPPKPKLGKGKLPTKSSGEFAPGGI